MTRPSGISALRPSLLSIMFAALSAILSGCSDGTGPAAKPPTPPVEGARPVASVLVTPANLALTVDASVALSATTRDADGVVLYGRTIVWSSSDTAVATVSVSGLVRARGAGTAAIRASSEGKSSTISVTVTATEPIPPTVAWILITPAGGLIPQAIGTSRQLGVIARASDGAEIVGRPVTWRSRNPAVASVDATGLMQAHAAGTAWVEAEVDGKRDSTLVSVPSLIARIEMDPATLTAVVSETRTVSATAVDAHGAVLARAFAWSSSNGAVATVDAEGRVTARGAGTAVITATSEGKSATTIVTVVGQQLRLTDAAGGPLPLVVDTTTIVVDGVARPARFQLSSGTLLFHDGRYELRLHGWLLVDGAPPVETTVGSEGIVMYDVFTGAPMLHEGEGTNQEPRFRTRIREDGGLEVDWSRAPGGPVVALGFAR